ncbi:uncharacterized protein EI97DRAFT_445306 [Westerdykella ornata]|uniref:Uncharacterized protein n=1 Tax=Westerdykella ornata TaxID=318751 RepID=A0A6A6J8Y6_WESOR|nr:uncharacterized protein EI97DRAFT_445306 [Westerdykella ornata]KAF2273030.1 hypothetical protein EI97DRAFT_445306 [Westerdykella ornata]
MGGTWYTVKTYFRDHDPRPSKPNPYSSFTYRYHHAYRYAPAAPAPAPAPAPADAPEIASEQIPTAEDDSDYDEERDADFLAEARRAAGRDPVTGRRLDPGVQAADGSERGRKGGLLGKLRRKKSAAVGRGEGGDMASSQDVSMSLSGPVQPQQQQERSQGGAAAQSSRGAQKYQTAPPVRPQTQTQTQIQTPPQPDLEGYYAPPPRQAREYYAPGV